MAEFDPAPRSLDQVVDPAWLSRMLSIRFPGTRVRHVEIVETLVTQATKVRLALDLGAASTAPAQVCIKGVLSATGVPSVASVGETLFYQTTAAQLPVRTPPCIYAGLSAGGDNGVVVMQDVIAQGGVFCSALDPFTPAEARDSLDQLACLHAAGWHDRPAYAPAWIPRFLDRMAASPFLPTATLQTLLEGARGDTLPPAMKDAARLERALGLLAAELRDQPSCLVHGDAHAGNIYRTPQGTGLVDWQIVQKGSWALDVAYHLAAVLTPADRRAHERALLDYYWGRLNASGGPALEREAAWNAYRGAMIYGYYLWSITQKVEPEIIEIFVSRLGLAADELQSFAVVGA